MLTCLHMFLECVYVYRLVQLFALILFLIIFCKVTHMLSIILYYTIYRHAMQKLFMYGIRARAFNERESLTQTHFFNGKFSLM